MVTPLFLACACKKSSDKAAAPSPSPAAAARLSLDKPNTLNLRAPDVFRAKFATSKGDFVVEAHRDWAPLGADRFYNLVKAGYYDETRFFRVVRGFMAQIGIHGKPELNTIWREQRIADDPVVKSNTRGFVSFATAGPGTRTTQFFINYADGNSRLDSIGFSPFGQVQSGMEVVDNLYAEYGEGAPQGRGPNQSRIQNEGNAYLVRDFPQLDFVKEATILP
ncbi:MAG: peptidylprolyl isomerase [Deltaproteobacteria bacterium]|nr:peptidylprolyl isomerase [Deltaproteobacteria bacterium]